MPCADAVLILTEKKKMDNGNCTQFTVSVGIAMLVIIHTWWWSTALDQTKCYSKWECCYNNYNKELLSKFRGAKEM